MRWGVRIAALPALLVSVCVSFAQQPSGPQTLGNLLQQAEEPQQPEVESTPKVEPKPAKPHTQGTYLRPEEGVQHPELDKCWTNYGEAVQQVNESVVAALTKLFDAAADKGDLDAADKWQGCRERFEKEGVLPDEKETQAVVRTALQGIKAANDELHSAYEQFVKSLTKEKKIAEAKGVRDEWRGLQSGQEASPSAPTNVGRNPAEPSPTPKTEPTLGERRVAARQKAGARKWNGHSYKAFQDICTWHEAKKRCEALGGHLVVIADENEQKFLVALLQQSGFPIDGTENGWDGIWIGATDEAAEGAWAWVDGSPMKYTNWSRFSPHGKQAQNHATMMFHHNGQWEDADNQAQLAFICEWDE